ncbi:MAG: hypothetical protein OER86_01040 [Phycisphaerae bacterium]|nr:hypothetical protein [Phycisphaerae bacterium]
MKPLIEQLDAVRSRARWLLVMMRGSAWLAAVLAVILAAGVIDYLLRLPPGLRLVLVLVGLAAAVATAIVRVGRSLRVNPALTALAMRLERLHPATAGRLASAVAFATQTPDATTDTPVAQHLSQQTQQAAEGLVESDQVRRLINPTKTIHNIGLLGIAILAVVLVAILAPSAFAIAVQRWANPLGGAEWPNRYDVEDHTNIQVAPNNSPIRMDATVVKGDRPNLRTQVHYRFLRHTPEGKQFGSWQSVLMTRQNSNGANGRYQRLIEPQTSADSLEYYFEAEDDQTHPKVIQLVQPPTLSSLIAEVDPPAYARELRPVQRHYLLQPPRPSVTLDALEGSRVRLRFTVEGSFRRPTGEGAVLDANATDAQQAKALRTWIDHTLVGFFDGAAEADVTAMHLGLKPIATSGTGTSFELGWTVRRPAQFRVTLTDQHGNDYAGQRLFRFEVRPDRAPRATILTPASDESVLPTAVVDIAAEARDDVAVAETSLVAQHNDPKRELITLAEDRTPQPQVKLQTKLDLGPLKLKAGDELALRAVVRDNFLLDGQRHDPVESSVRKLLIISDQELVQQLRTDLAELRQRAIRAQTAQTRISQSPAGRQTAQQQRDLGERIDSMQRTVKQLQKRAERNRLKNDWLNNTFKEAGKLIRQAGATAGQAADKLSRAAQDPAGKKPETKQQLEQGREQQKRTENELGKLVRLLDQGRDAYELQQELVKLSKDQGKLADRVARMTQRTLGRSPDQLEPKDRQELKDVASDQKNLADRAGQLNDRMRSTAAAISRQSNRPDEQAVAEALKNAADTATQENLDKKMKEASKAAAGNRMAQAQSRQQQAMDTIRKMLDQIGQADKIRQEILRRRLMELVEAIRKLRDQQKAQLDRLIAADVFDALDAAMLTLRRNTLAVSEDAREADPKTVPVADLLDEAAQYQAEAVQALRAPTVARVAVQAGEEEALAKLEAALKLAEELSKEANKDAAEEERQKLIAAYNKALEEQKAILVETEQLVAVEGDDRNRRWQQRSRRTGDRQADLRTSLNELQAKVDDTIVYKAVHQQIDVWIDAALADLRQASPGTRTTFNQTMVIASLEALIKALGQDPPDEQFAQDPGGGGGGGGGGKPPLIPPLAELKLLRARQTQIYDTTKMADKIKADDADRATIVEDLGTQQKQLGVTGDQLVESLKRQGAGQ